MVRARFKTAAEDYRPVQWPPPGPYWCSGYDPDGKAVIVAYAESEAELRRFWPEAEEFDAEPASDYTFTSRFLKPGWFKG